MLLVLGSRRPRTLARMVVAVNVLQSARAAPDRDPHDRRRGLASARPPPPRPGGLGPGAAGVPAADGDAVRAARRARCERHRVFLLGMTVARYPDVTREIAARGHEIGSHGYAHGRVYDANRDGVPRRRPAEHRRDRRGNGQTAGRLPRARVLDQPRHAVGLRRPRRARVPLRLESAREPPHPEPHHSRSRLALPDRASFREEPLGAAHAVSPARACGRRRLLAPLPRSRHRPCASDHVVAGPLFPSIRVRPATLAR